MNQWQPQGLFGWRSARGGDQRGIGAFRYLDGGIRELERLPHGRDDGGQDGIGVQSRLQALAEAGKHNIRFITQAIQQAVDAALQEVTQRLKKHGHDTCSNERDDQVSTRAERGSQVADHEDIDADDERGEQTVDQRAVDDDINVPQPVAQDGDADRDRKQE